MEKHEIVTTVVQTIVQVQELSGRAGDGIDASTCPLRDVEGFDSLSGLEATVMLSEALGVAISEDCNPFISKDGNRALSVGEIADNLSTHIGPETIAK